MLKTRRQRSFWARIELSMMYSQGPKPRRFSFKFSCSISFQWNCPRPQDLGFSGGHSLKCPAIWFERTDLTLVKAFLFQPKSSTLFPSLYFLISGTSFSEFCCYSILLKWLVIYIKQKKVSTPNLFFFRNFLNFLQKVQKQPFCGLYALFFDGRDCSKGDDQSPTLDAERRGMVFS